MHADAAAAAHGHLRAWEAAAAAAAVAGMRWSDRSASQFACSVPGQWMVTSTTILYTPSATPWGTTPRRCPDVELHACRLSQGTLKQGLLLTEARRPSAASRHLRNGTYIHDDNVYALYGRPLFGRPLHRNTRVPTAHLAGCTSLDAGAAGLVLSRVFRARRAVFRVRSLHHARATPKATVE